jgi:chitooligosaccharide deacetylase NodB
MDIFRFTGALLAGAILGAAGLAGPARAQDTTTAADTVALTFDDGPSSTYTPQVLDVLAEHQVKATFCLVGSQARRFPALVRRIVAEGHALCNHSMNHDNLSTWTDEQIRADLTAATQAIQTAAPGAPVPYFRAPYGSWGRSATVAAKLGMARLGWTVDPRDWSRPGVDAIVEAVHTQLRPGGIVLMHDAGGDRSQTVQALALLIPQLRDDGWTFTFPPTLL